MQSFLLAHLPSPCAGPGWISFRGPGPGFGDRGSGERFPQETFAVLLWLENCCCGGWGGRGPEPEVRDPYAPSSVRSPCPLRVRAGANGDSSEMPLVAPSGWYLEIAILERGGGSGRLRDPLPAGPRGPSSRELSPSLPFRSEPLTPAQTHSTAPYDLLPGRRRHLHLTLH